MIQLTPQQIEAVAQAGNSPATLIDPTTQANRLHLIGRSASLSLEEKRRPSWLLTRIALIASRHGSLKQEETERTEGAIFSCSPFPPFPPVQFVRAMLLVVNSKQVHCITYDDLYEALLLRIRYWPAAAKAEDIE